MVLLYSKILAWAIVHDEAEILADEQRRWGSDVGETAPLQGFEDLGSLRLVNCVGTTGNR